MSKTRIKSVLSIVMIMLVIILAASATYAKTTADYITDTTDRITPSDGYELETARDKVWGSVRLILQVLAISVFLFAGVRYMFASADQRADMKKSMVVIILGVFIVFGTTLVIDIVTKAGEQLMGK